MFTTTHISKTARVTVSARPFLGISVADQTVITRAAERKLLRRKILIQSAQLRNSISSRVKGTTIHVGTNKKYARVHQLGGEAGRKTARVQVPARPFLGISDADQTVITRAVERHVLGGL